MQSSCRGNAVKLSSSSKTTPPPKRRSVVVSTDELYGQPGDILTRGCEPVTFHSRAPPKLKRAHRWRSPAEFVIQVGRVTPTTRRVYAPNGFRGPHHTDHPHHADPRRV